MSQITLHMRGPFRVLSQQSDVEGLSRRAQAMLAFLAEQPGMRAERARLASLLWSDRSEDQARASLRQELSMLRRLLPENLLSANRQSVWLDPDRVSVRTETNGDAMEGFDLPSEDFEDWLRTLRMRTEAREVNPAATERMERAELRGKPSLAVMPFDDLSGSRDMLGEGIVEEITGALSRVKDFHVIARQSAFALRDSNLSVPDVADTLGAQYLVEGTVQRSGERVRVSVQLVRGSDGHAVWAARFDDRIDDLFDLQDRIAKQVAGQLSPSLRSAEIARAEALPEADRNAYSLTLAALPHFWAHRWDENDRAIELLDEALAHSPDYLPALAYKAWCHGHRCCYFWCTDPEAEREIVEQIHDRIAGVAQDDPNALVALSAALTLASSEFDRSEAYVERALVLDPNNAWGWMRKGWNLLYLGQFEEALDAFDVAEDLSPLDPFQFNICLGQSAVLRAQKKFDESIELIERGLKAGPGVVWAYRMLFGTYAMMGEHEKAREAALLWRQHNPQINKAMIRNLIPKWTHDPEYTDILYAFLAEVSEN